MAAESAEHKEHGYGHIDEFDQDRQRDFVQYKRHVFLCSGSSGSWPKRFVADDPNSFPGKLLAAFKSRRRRRGSINKRPSERVMDDEGEDHPRLVIHNFLSPDECKELEFIHKSCGAVGYRPNVFSTTLSHLIATNSAHLIMPFVPIRERIKEKVEEFFGCEFELFIEFTGLISWSRGASIGWHSDDNRPYLRQRDFAAVCYLNNHGKDFKGGHFHFQDGEQTTIVPLAGDAIMYTADSRNVHSVDEIVEGERLTLTLWFSRDSSHDEDAKLVSRLSQRLLQSSVNAHDSYLPLPASSSMYWFSPVEAPTDQLGFDILWARMHILGYDIYFSRDTSCFLDVSELLMEPLKLARGCELFHQEFRNILHALQVVQFYCWKASELQTSKVEVEMGKVTDMSQSQVDKISHLKSIYSKDNQQVEAVFGYAAGKHHFDWAKFSAAIDAWEDYTCRLHKEMVMSLPHWKTHQSIFCVST